MLGENLCPVGLRDGCGSGSNPTYLHLDSIQDVSIVQPAEMISLIRSGCIRSRTEVLTREVKKERMSV